MIIIDREELRVTGQKLVVQYATINKNLNLYTLQ